MKYICDIPKTVPDDGTIVVHNHVKPAAPIGTNGFRVWLDDPSDKYERCLCDWGGGIEHYRVKRDAVNARPTSRPIA